MLSEGVLGPAQGSGSPQAGPVERHDGGSASDPSHVRPPARRPQFVREAQRALRDLGYPPGPIDGTIGPKTRAALARYQSAENLPVTGELDAETTTRLDVHKRLFRPSRES